MSPLVITLSIIQLVFCVALIIVIVLQQGKSAGLSGAISGASETFFGKNRAKTMEAKLEKATIFIAVVFGILTIVLYVIH